MDAELLEIVELPDGEIALKRVDGDSSPLVKIRFSEESVILLDRMKMAVASAMIEAGMHAYAELCAEPLAGEEDPAILH